MKLLNNKGITYIEIIMVIIIGAILSVGGIVQPDMLSTPEDSAITEIIGNIQMIQSFSMAKGSRATSDEKRWISFQPNYFTRTPVTQTENTYKTVKFPQNVTFVQVYSAEGSLSGSKICFDSLGRPLNSAGTPSDMAIVLSYKNRAYEINVSKNGAINYRKI